MVKVEIKMDINKIREEGKYDPEFVFASIDDAHFKYGFRKEILEDKAICYWGNNDRNDFGYFTLVIWKLSEQDWFAPYVDRWFWYNNDDLPIEGFFRREDIAEQFLKRKSA